jgi:uncharacterized SAM-binding protein YcdF (DUF218 family)
VIEGEVLLGGGSSDPWDSTNSSDSSAAPTGPGSPDAWDSPAHALDEVETAVNAVHRPAEFELEPITPIAEPNYDEVDVWAVTRPDHTPSAPIPAPGEGRAPSPWGDDPTDPVSGLAALATGAPPPPAATTPDPALARSAVTAAVPAQPGAAVTPARPTQPGAAATTVLPAQPPAGTTAPNPVTPSGRLAHPRPRRRWGRIALRTALVLVLLAVGYFAVSFYQVWSTGRSDQARKVDAIVVMGAAQYDGRPSPQLQARLDHAAELYAAGDAPIVVVTGGNQPGDRFTEAQASATYLKAHGVPSSAILEESTGHSTWESLDHVRSLLQPKGADRILIVTDPYHSLRSRLIAQELEFTAYTSPTRTSPVKGTTALGKDLKEAAGIAAGRVIGFQRLWKVTG